MAKAVKKKASVKKRAKQYDPKLKINGSFADVVSVSVGKKLPENKDEKQ
jgi:hypothetical protein